MSLLFKKVLRRVLTLALITVSVTATARAAELSAQAREPYQKGMAAAQKQDWQLALRYFREAQKADPEASDIWFNLGLTASKLPGYEVRAIAFFKAYLLANPDAPKAEAIRGQITKLEAEFESKVGAILKQLESILISQKAEPSRNYTPEVLQARASIQMQAGWSLAEGRLFLGDTSGALKGLRQTNGDDWLQGWQEYGKKNGTIMALAVSMAAAGKLEDVSEMAPRQYDRELVGFFLEQGDVAGAQRFLNPAATDGWSTLACLGDFGGNENLRYESLKSAKTDITDLLGSGVCERDLWWSVGRLQYLLQRGIGGIMVNYQYDDTQLTPYFLSRELDSPHSGYALSGLSSAASNLSGLLLEYRKIRGPAAARDDYAEAYYQGGRVYYGKHDYDRAIRYYLQALRINPDYAAAYKYIGHSYYNQKQYDQAIQNYERAVRIDSNLAEAYFFIGHCYNFKGQYDLAVKNYNKAMRLDPDYGMPADIHANPK